MVGIVVVSHSSLVAEGVKEIVAQMAPEVNIQCAAGTFDGRLGSDVDKILKAIKKAYSEDGVLVFYDLGSSCMNAEIAIELLDEYKKEKVKIAYSPLVEGALLAAVDSSINKKIDYIKNTVESMRKKNS